MNFSKRALVLIALLLFLAIIGEFLPKPTIGLIKSTNASIAPTATFTTPKVQTDQIPTVVIEPAPTSSPTVFPLITGTRKIVDDLQSSTKIDTSEKVLGQKLFQPLIDLAQRRRLEWQKNSSYQHRINPSLNNKDRVNFLLVGFGETHEPPVTNWAIISSPTIVSCNFVNNSCDLISFTHDIWSPEIRKILRPAEKGLAPKISERISEAYQIGGLPLLKEIMENASGLSIDFVVTFKDKTMRDFVYDVLGNQLEVEVPLTFQAYPFWMEKVMFPTNGSLITFSQGKQKFDANWTIGFIKTVPVPDQKGHYPKSIEHNRRKELVMKAILGKIGENQTSLVFWKNLSGFALGKWAISKIPTTQRTDKDLDFDFDPEILAAQMLVNLGNSIQSDHGDLALPKISKQIYVADPLVGDGGVHWINGDMEIPYFGDPDKDWVDSYWKSVRDLIEVKLKLN